MLLGDETRFFFLLHVVFVFESGKMGESRDEDAGGGGAEKKVKRESEDVGLAQKEEADVVVIYTKHEMG